MLLPHLHRARLLVKLACLRAQLHFQHGRSSESIDDLIAAMTLGRHISNDAVIVSLLTSYGIENRAIEVAAGHLNTLDTAGLRYLSEQLDTLPTCTTLAQAILNEKDVYLEGVITLLSEPSGKDRLLAKIDSGDPDAKVIKEMSQTQLTEGAIGLRSFYGPLAAMAQLPLAEIEFAEKELTSDTRLNGPARLLGEKLLPAVSRARQVEIRHLTLVAMLRAAIAVCQNGEAALSAEAHQDPFAGVPLQYEKTPGGFRLQSKTLIVDGQPISLVVGRNPPK